MNVIAAAKSDPGRRPNNEDRWAIFDARALQLRVDAVLAVADGMGGRSLGEKAAEMAIQTIERAVEERREALASPDADLEEILRVALRRANDKVYALSRDAEDGRGMGTTCIAAIVQGQQLAIAHAGDSRAYLLRAGHLERITQDHSYVAEQVKSGAITEEGARQSRFRNVITRAVGIEPSLEPETSSRRVYPGDQILLCSDGLTNTVDEGEIAGVLYNSPAPQAAADRLIQLAIRAGGKDNITAVVARIESDNRTQQMNTEEMAQPPMLAAEQPMAEAPASFAPRAPAAKNKTVRKRRRHPLPTLLILLLAAACAALTAQLRQTQYRLAQARSHPFVAAAVPAPSPNPPLSQFAQLRYAPPKILYPDQVQGGLLAISANGQTITAATLSGKIIQLSPQGRLLAYQEPLPKDLHAGTIPVFPAAGDQYSAIDPAGNIYVSETANKEIVKYGPNLSPLGKIPGLVAPAALAVAPNGAIYVIDNSYLKVISPL